MRRGEMQRRWSRALRAIGPELQGFVMVVCILALALLVGLVWAAIWQQTVGAR